MKYEDRYGEGQLGSKRVIRGGSWNSNARNVRAAYRNWNAPDNRNDNLGFRLARALGWAGWLAMDPVGVVSAPRCGEQKMGPGVEVGATCSPSNPRRSPALSARGVI